MNLSLQSIARALGGEVSGRRVRAPGPGHSPKDRSLAISISNDAPDGFVLHSFANDHWNFNVRGFNPGGNHGSFLRISTHSALMLAGGNETGIPRNVVIEEPYDSLSFVPTILELLGRHAEAASLPGKPIGELLSGR